MPGLGWNWGGWGWGWGWPQWGYGYNGWGGYGYGYGQGAVYLQAPSTTVVYTHVLNKGGRGVASPLDRLTQDGACNGTG